MKHIKNIFWIIIFLSSSMGVSPSIFAQANLPPSEIKLNSFSLDQLQQAAEAGDPDAQYALGYMYYYGKNVPQNTSTGLNWIKRASVQGQEQALQAMRELAPVSVSKKTVFQSSVVEEEIQVEPVQRIKTTEVAVSNVPEIKKVSGEYYTIQLLVTSNKTELNRYVQQNGLGNKATYYASEKNQRMNYVLLYGTYKTRSEAQASLLKLPAAVKTQKPWIKQIKQVKGN